MYSFRTNLFCSEPSLIPSTKLLRALSGTFSLSLLINSKLFLQSAAIIYMKSLIGSQLTSLIQKIVIRSIIGLQSMLHNTWFIYSVSFFILLRDSDILLPISCFLNIFQNLKYNDEEVKSVEFSFRKVEIFSFCTSEL